MNHGIYQSPIPRFFRHFLFLQYNKYDSVQHLQNTTLYIIVLLISIHATLENDFPTNTLSSPNTAYAIK